MAINEWSTTAASNASGVTGVNWAEGQAPSTVNDSARAMMADVAAWYGGAKVPEYLTGVAGTNTVTAGGPASMAAYTTGQRVYFVPAVTNTGATTLNITPSGGAALGAKNIFWNAAALVGGELRASVPYTLEYDGTQFNILSAGSSLQFKGASPTANRIPYAVGSSALLQDSANLTFDGTTLSVGGGQVAFPASQNASADVNTLDDYEEGTFTPALTFGGGATGMTYSARVGIYTKIGRVVHFQIYFALSAKGSSTGAASLGGLPFTVAGSNSYSACVIRGDVLAAGTTTQLTGQIDSGATTITPQRYAAGALNGLADTDFNNTSNMIMGGSYVV